MRRGGPAPSAARRDDMHACEVMQLLGRYPQASPGEPVEFESGLSPPPIEVTRAAPRALRAVLGGERGCCLCGQDCMCFMSCAIY